MKATSRSKAKAPRKPSKRTAQKGGKNEVRKSDKQSNRLTLTVDKPAGDAMLKMNGSVYVRVEASNGSKVFAKIVGIGESIPTYPNGSPWTELSFENGSQYAYNNDVPVTSGQCNNGKTGTNNMMVYVHGFRTVMDPQPTDVAQPFEGICYSP